MRHLWLLALVLALSSCAPMIVGRTPEPPAPGTFDVAVGAGYPYSHTTIPVCESFSFDCSEGFISAGYYPLGSPLSIMVSQGLEGETEINYTLGVSEPIFGPLLRIGGKTLLYDDTLKFAADYGIFAGFANAGLDVGLLASTQLEGAELYEALRGFGNSLVISGPNYSAEQMSISGALTLGVAADISFAKGVFAELTFATSSYNGIDIRDPQGNPWSGEVQPIGFSILPAIGIRF